MMITNHERRNISEGTLSSKTADDFFIRLWGVRGSTAAAGAEVLLYGGHTSCFEIRVGGKILIVDCGTGAQRLGEALMREAPRVLDLYFTHTHLDHICGLPFFAPVYDPSFKLRCWAGHLSGRIEFAHVMERIMSAPIFPLAAHNLRSLSFYSYDTSKVLPRSDRIRITAVPLNHPGGGRGYRIAYQGKALCIITDHEHGDEACDQRILEFVRGADLLLYDGMFCEEEYPSFRGWGHSTWEKGAALAREAEVKKLLICHHAPTRTDTALHAFECLIQERHPCACFARQDTVHVL